jgi:CheY-like chemotaxis protein
MFSSAQSPLVLLIEDSDDDAFFFRWTVRRAGIACTITHITDGGEALEYLRDVLAGRAPRPDVIFLDLKLPTATGFDILAWARAQDFDPPLKVVLLSGSELANDLTQAAELGVAAYCIKPISQTALREYIGESPAVLKGGAQNVA